MPGVAKQVARSIALDIDDYSIHTYFEPHRWHLGASLIGHACSRYLWYVFRWVGVMRTSGDTITEQRENLARMQRLFNRGHREEERYIEYLKAIGFEVWSHQPGVLHYHPESEAYWIGDKFENPDGLVEDVTGIEQHEKEAKKRGIERKQIRMAACEGHFGGSLDTVVRFPERYAIDEPVLGEFKTSGTGPGFNALVEKGVNLAKQQHYTQMSTYGAYHKLRHAAYFCVNKNDDSLHVEIVKLDWNLGENMLLKAERIITAVEPPPKLALDPKFKDCVYCDFKDICHNKAKVEFNCRSCKFAQPIAGGEWYCNAHNGTIPREYVPQGCGSYEAIVNG